MFEIVINSPHHHLLIWSVIYAVVFCLFVIGALNAGSETDLEILSVLFVVVFVIFGGLLSSYLCTEQTADGLREIPWAFWSFWGVTAVWSAVGTFLLVLVRFLLQIRNNR